MMNKKTFAQVWMALVFLGIIGYAEYHLWKTMGLSGGLWIHGGGLVIMTTLWSWAVLSNNDTGDNNSNDSGW